MYKTCPREKLWICEAGLAGEKKKKKKKKKEINGSTVTAHVITVSFIVSLRKLYIHQNAFSSLPNLMKWNCLNCACNYNSKKYELHVGAFKGLYTNSIFPAIFTMETIFVTSCLLSYTLILFRKGVYSIKEEFAPRGSKFFPLIVDPSSKGRQCRHRWLSWKRRPTGDQEVAGSTPAEVGNILS